jgi:regulator of replication initiation timing
LTKAEVLQRERAKLTEIFKDVEPAKAQLVEGLIEDAAFLRAENHQLRELIEKTGGMVQTNLLDPSRQKTSEASKQYLKNLNSYAVVVKTLNGILMKNTIEGEDEFDKFIKQQQGA